VKSRAAAWLCGSVVLLALAGCSWREIEEKEIEIGYRGEARVRPFLAASRFLARMGLDVEDRFSLETLPESGVVLWLPAEGDNTPSSAARIAKWVADGGHVIYLLRGADSFINDFAEEARWDDEDEEEEKDREPGDKAGKGEPAESRDTEAPPEEPPGEAGEPAEADEENADASQEATFASPLLEELGIEIRDREEAVNRVRLGDTDLGVEIPAGSGFAVPRRLRSPGKRFAAGPPGARAFVSFPRGEGRVTLLADAKALRNRYVGEPDHAAFLWNVIELEEAGHTIWMVRSTKTSLFQLIWRHGRMAVISGGLFLILWLWWITRRFGPSLPDPETGNREFAQHLAMSGKFLWARTSGGALVEPVRRRIRQRLQWSDGDGRVTAGEFGAESMEALVRRSGLSREAIEHALTADPPREPGRFAVLMNDLQTLDSLK